jgi:hypothetical protein
VDNRIMGWIISSWFKQWEFNCKYLLVNINAENQNSKFKCKCLIHMH